ncbi:HD domain-containing protein [Kibdelosporangium philippinense]|uniref:HD domain-containing protein n=1 Tax=Kibdelosporangium philippinense TaxID=211113 RepID=A0ABS8ZDC4_9PSEU|nr:HD domain-containing protein [Kibdelosporangium philippinense]MCE7003822.1 HD domain-containing protein [Kibdelosporangium philippinense]
MAVGGILGRGGRYRDPMWELEVRLTPLEQHLLRTWELRRLQFIAHGGASALTTHQTYTRLEHSLGLFALAAHFAPTDWAARVSALLHDIGHLPFSHTLEGLAGLHHHRLGEQRMQSLGPLLASHGMSVDEVLAIESGSRPSVLRGERGLKLDHLESFLRSGRAHGRLTESPPETLRRLWVSSGAVHTDLATAKYLGELAIGEAQYLCSWEDAVANGVMRGLVALVLDDVLDRIPQMTDDELWSVLLSDPRTSLDAQRLRRDPLGWEITVDEGYPYEVAKLYLTTACVDGVPIELPASELPSLPWKCRIAWRS